MRPVLAHGLVEELGVKLVVEPACVVGHLDAHAIVPHDPNAHPAVATLGYLGA